MFFHDVASRAASGFINMIKLANYIPTPFGEERYLAKLSKA